VQNIIRSERQFWRDSVDRRLIAVTGLSDDEVPIGGQACRTNINNGAHWETSVDVREALVAAFEILHLYRYVDVLGVDDEHDQRLLDVLIESSTNHGHLVFEARMDETDILEGPAARRDLIDTASLR
jgi:hypothetical protein